MKGEIQINLSGDEALILFEFLSRFSSEGILEIADQSEERVLWNIQCDLEKILEAPFSEEYKESLKASRARIRDEI